MDPIDRLKADVRHKEWQEFFLVTTNVRHLEESNTYLRDIHLFVKYIDFLRDKRNHRYFHLPSAAVGSGLTVLLISLLLGFFGFIS